MLNLLFISNEDTRRVAFQTEEYAINIVIVITSYYISRASTKIENALTQNSLISKNELALPETSKEKEKNLHSIQQTKFVQGTSNSRIVTKQNNLGYGYENSSR